MHSNRSYTRGLAITSKQSGNHQVVYNSALKSIGLCYKGNFSSHAATDCELLHMFRRYIGAGRSLESRKTLMNYIKVERAAGIN